MVVDKISIHAPRVGRDAGSVISTPMCVISIHAPRVGRDVGSLTHCHVIKSISIHAPRVGRDGSVTSVLCAEAGISIHAPRVGRDHRIIPFTARLAQFQSTRPVWGATSIRSPARRCRGDFNPRAPCGARPPMLPPPPRGSDFNPRAPCGARRSTALSSYRSTLFQSTRPVWGATSCASTCVDAVRSFQSTRPVWGATPFRRFGCQKPLRISIHAPRVGRDQVTQVEIKGLIGFQSTRPVWGATLSSRFTGQSSVYFNPRAPCGARLEPHLQMRWYLEFQSTRPVWGATTV